MSVAPTVVMMVNPLAASMAD
jgi:hypothetical protein